MLFLIRKIKRVCFENKQFHNYLLYALGEMVLVVIGILVALQINNWNNDKQLREKLWNHLEIVANNIANDLESVQAIRSERERAYESSVRWLNLSDRDGMLNASEVAFAYRTHTMASALHHFNANAGGYEALKNSGTLDQMAGRNIESLLYDYYDTVNRIVLEERDHNEYVRLLGLQALANWPAELASWEFAIPEVLTADRFLALEPVYQEMLRGTSTEALHGTPQAVAPLLRDYEKLDHLGRALRQMADTGIMDFNDSITGILAGIHDPRSGIGDPTVITGGQVSWHSYSLLNSDSNDHRISYEAVDKSRKSPFGFRSFERIGNSLHYDYQGGVEWAGIWFSIGSFESNVPCDFSGYEKLVLELKGDVGGETVQVNMEDRDDAMDGTSTKVPLQLTDQWKTYEIDLADFETANLEILTVPFGFVFYEEPVSFSVRTAKFVKSE